MYFCAVLCIVCFVSFSVLFVCICVLNYCHRMATQLQLNIYHIITMVDLTLPIVTGQVTPMIVVFQSKQRNIPEESSTKPLREPRDLAANNCRSFCVG